MNTLQARISNCLDTILELQPGLRRLYRTAFAEDFACLRAYAAKVAAMRAEEEDVERLESMTAAFIQELEFTSNCHSARQIH